MAKTSGLGNAFYLGGYDLSGDISSLGSAASKIGLLDSTGISKSANERMQGLRDGTMALTAFFNPSAGQAHPRLAALPTADVIGTYCFGTTLGDEGVAIVGRQVDYAGKRSSDGAFTLDAAIEGDGYGLDWGRQLTAGKRADVTATNGASIDYGALVGTTAFGLRMYVHLHAFTGTSVTIKVQSSTDDAVGDPFADVTGATTGALSAIGAVRVATGPTASVERYLRVVTTGTFTVATFSVLVARGEAGEITP